MARLRKGDGRAFDEVWQLHHGRVHAFLVRLLGRRDLAEDLLQETFVRLALAARKLREDTRLVPWLFTVARNLAVSFRRWQLVDETRLSMRWHADGEQEPPSPFDEAAASEAERQLERALAALPGKYREVLLLVGVERFSQEEAAAMLRLRPDALRQRLRRARDMLEGRLAKAEARSRRGDPR